MRCKKKPLLDSKSRRQTSMTRGYRSWFQDLINIWTMPANMLKNKVMYRQLIHSVTFVNSECCTCLRPLYIYSPDTPRLRFVVRDSSFPCKITFSPLGTTQRVEPRGSWVKVKKCLFRSGQTKRVPGNLDSQISRQSSHEGVSALRTGRLYPQELFLVLIYVRG